MPKKLKEENLNTPDYYNEKYRDYWLDKPIKVEIAKRKQMIDGLENGMRVVELGCGVSSFPLTIKKEYPDCEVHALDFADKVIGMFKDAYPEIYYLVGEATKTPYENDYFDYVIAGELIEHIPNPKDLVKEMARICKTKGVISVSTPFEEKSWRPNDIPLEHIWEYERDDMIDLFSKYGKVKIRFFIDKSPGKQGIHMVVNCKL